MENGKEARVRHWKSIRISTLFAALVALTTAAACDKDPGLGVEGTFPVTISYTTDTCADDQNTSEVMELKIDRQDNNVTIVVTGAGTLTGTFDPEERLMTVNGTVSVPDTLGGSFAGEMLMFARVTNDVVNVSGAITFEGTFPGVSGTCERAFLGSGPRGNRSLPLTGP